MNEWIDKLEDFLTNRRIEVEPDFWLSLFDLRWYLELTFSDMYGGWKIELSDNWGIHSEARVKDGDWQTAIIEVAKSLTEDIKRSLALDTSAWTDEQRENKRANDKELRRCLRLWKREIAKWEKQ